jgi:hypothetical protein
MNQREEMIAVCGLECHKCDIREATDNPQVAQQIADWFKKKRNEDVKLEDIRCLGCKGDRNRHWSADCWILQCCVDEKGHQFCCDCDQFPCDRLVEWSRQGERYGNALDRLKRMKAGSEA